MTTPAACVKLADNVTLGTYPLYVKGTGVKCSGAAAIVPTSPLFFGNDENDDPIFAAMSYKQYMMAKYGIMAASAAALGLGIATVVLGVKVFGKRGV